jgi:BlaI family transcriptional regulator, penicillinase repressor
MIDAARQRQYSLHMRRFTPGELSVMGLLWEHGALKPSAIQELYPEPIKNPALRSYLKILLDKGHVTRRKVGKAYEYRAVTPQRTAFRSTLRDLIDVYCEGSIRALIVNLIRTEKLSEAELVHLKRLADETQTPAPGDGGERR